MSGQFCYFCKREYAESKCETCKRMVCHQCAGPHNHNCYPREGRASRSLAAALGAAALFSSSLSAQPPEKIYSKPGMYDGPVWDMANEQLLFTKYSRSGGKILRWKPGSEVDSWSINDWVISGLRRTRAGELTGADFIHHTLVRVAASRNQINTVKPFASDSSDGAFVQPNDLVEAHNGWTYVTDPDFKHSAKSAVWAVSPSGKRKKWITNLKQPNGIATSPDSRFLYVSDSSEKVVYRYLIWPEGNPEPQSRSLFFTPPSRESGDMDGLTLDSHGNLLVVAKNSLWAVSPTGELLGEQKFHINCTNVAVAPLEVETAFVTCENAVFRVPLPLPSP